MVKEKKLGPQRGQPCQPNLKHLNPALRFLNYVHTFCLVEKPLFSFLLMTNSAVDCVSCLSLDILRVCSGNASA